MIRAHYLMDEYDVDANDEGVTVWPSRKKHPPPRGKAMRWSRPRRFGCHPLPPRWAIRLPLLLLLLLLLTDDDPEVGLVQFQHAYKIVVVRQVVDRPQRQ